MARLALYLPKGKSLQNQTGQVLVVYSEAWGCYWVLPPGALLGDNNWSNNAVPYYVYEGMR